eukprot:2337174-Alexandrium_andersonii.AAC.1
MRLCGGGPPLATGRVSDTSGRRADLTRVAPTTTCSCLSSFAWMLACSPAAPQYHSSFAFSLACLLALLLAWVARSLA